MEKACLQSKTICITSKLKNNGTRRRFESTGENYGFSENAPTVTLTSSDSTNCSFVLGEANSMTGDYYLKREDSGEIYTVSSALADSFHKTLTENP